MEEPTAYEVWNKLKNIPVDQNDFIECDFLHFEKGTFKEEIWHWIEDKYDVPIAKLMGYDGYE